MTPKDEPNIRTVFGFFKGNHNFPDRSTKTSLDNFCKKQNLSDHVVKAFDAVWNDFISKPNAKFYRTGFKTKSRKKNPNLSK